MHTAARLSIVIAVAMAMAAAWGLLDPGLYRDNAFVTAGWRGNDLVTLFVATPILLGALPAARKGSLRGHLLWLGSLDYAFYNSAFYLFGSWFNAAFLLYVAVFTLSIFALVFALVALDIDRLRSRPLSHAIGRGVSAWLGLVAVGLGGFHTAIAIASARTGQRPVLLDRIGHPTNVVAALDLPFVVAVSALAAWWLWRREAWGFVLAAMTVIKGAIYMLALSAATVTAAWLSAGGDLGQVWLWGGIGVGCLIAAVALLREV